jgi:hypothetical protein
MGCDIHLSVEYRRKTKKHDHDSYWNSFGGIAQNYGRNYNLFSKMNREVRNPDGVQGFEERGLPSDIDHFVKSKNECYVMDCETDAEDCCSRSDAERWVKNGSSKWVNDEKTWVTQPDWHSHSWLTFEEFKECVFETCDFGWGIRWHSIVSAMETMESNGFETRVVFWFDN